MQWVFYSSKTGNTQRLMERAGLDALRLPQAADAQLPCVEAPFVLVTPTFGDAQGKGAVPKPVIRFLNVASNRQWLRAVVACGDRNFGAQFASAGDVIARKCAVPLLLRIEGTGTQADWQRLQAIDLHLSRSPNFSRMDELQ